VNTTPADASVTQLGQGFYWQDLVVGQRLRTHRRTLTEADLVGFIGVTGMLEAIFIDATPAPGGITGRPVPALLTTAIIEGFLFQSMIQGTGLALLETTSKAHAPVRVGDTVHGIVTVAGVKPTSKGNRAIVDSSIDVFNQHGELVLTYTAKRLLAGRE
jgi:3-hydroxybutyryl-CoA dehydratase